MSGYDLSKHGPPQLGLLCTLVVFLTHDGAEAEILLVNNGGNGSEDFA
jgi:hypothetical protein